MKYTLWDGYLESECYCDKLLDGLAGCRVVQFSKLQDGNFDVQEMCDEYFGVKLTKEQLIDLGNEIIALANS